jgi:hypothetical protein
VQTSVKKLTQSGVAADESDGDDADATADSSSPESANTD